LTPEKKIDALTIKLAESQLNQLRLLAEVDGVSVSEYVRVLIDHDFDSKRARWAALDVIFGQSPDKPRADNE
jgi:hypothetical protein